MDARAQTCVDEHGVRTEEYQQIRYLAGFGILSYPICVPIGYLLLFCKARRTPRSNLLSSSARLRNSTAAP